MTIDNGSEKQSTKKRRRQRKFNGSSSSLASIKSREDNTIINDGDNTQLRNVTHDSLDLKVTGHLDASENDQRQVTPVTRFKAND